MEKDLVLAFPHRVARHPARVPVLLLHDPTEEHCPLDDVFGDGAAVRFGHAPSSTRLHPRRILALAGQTLPSSLQQARGHLARRLEGAGVDYEAIG